MGLILNIVIALVVIVALFAMMRRFQMKAAKVALAEGLAAKLLSQEPDQGNRQELADILKSWDFLARDQKAQLGDHLAAHPRLEGVDLNDPRVREQTYMDLVGIAKGQSPEK